jgi:DNA polymerase-1
MIEPNIILVTERQKHFERIGWTKFSGLYEALEDLDQYESLQADLETTGLSGFINETAFSLQLGVPTVQYVFDMETIPWKEVKKILEEKELIGHNLLFDIPYLYKQGIVPQKVFDTFLAETVLTQGLIPTYGRRRSLDGCLERYLGIELNKDLQKTINQGLISVEAIEYSGSDVIHLHDLKEAMLKVATRRKLVDQIDFENRFLRVLAYIEFSGVKVDPEKLFKFIRRIEAEEFYAEEKLRTYADINWASSQQVGEYLQSIGIEHIKEETGKLQTGEEILNLHQEIPVVQDLLVYRGLTKLVSTYGRKWFHYIQKDGRIHTKYKQIMDTGRTSSGEMSKKGFDPWDTSYVCEKPYPNLQNVIKDKEFRACFIPEGRNSFAILDYSSQEPVIFADKCRDKGMLDFYQKEEGGDFHSFTTRLIFRELINASDEEIKEKHPDKRQKSKAAYLATTYLGNGKTIADNLNIPLEEGVFVYEGLLEAFPGMKDFFRERYEFALARGFHQTNTVFGGKRFFDRFQEFKDLTNDRGYWRKYYNIKNALLEGSEVSNKDLKWYEWETEDKIWYRAQKSEMRKESVNTLIQGTAAVMSKLAGIYILDWIERNKMFGRVMIPMFIHDEFILESNTRSIERVAQAAQECMKRAGDECLDLLRIRVEPIIAREWRK